jgi:hypothetical protein
MEIFDCFCGIGRWAKRDSLLPWRADDILALMDHFGIARALAYSNSAASGGWAPEADRILMEDIRDRPRLTPALTLTPHSHHDTPTPEEHLTMLRQCGARAVWMWPGAFWPWLSGDLMDMCCAARLPVLLYAEERNPDDINRLCTDFPDLRLILAGVAYGSDKWLYALLRRHEHVHVCLGHFYIPAGGPMRFLKHFPAERLLFGSGLPRFSPGGLIGHIAYADISDDDKENILGRNLERMLSEARI